MAFLDDLQGYWKLDESSGNAVDSSGNANTLTNGNTSVFSAGKVNNAVSFVRASKQSLYVADADRTLPITGDLSIMLWAKMSTQPSTGNTFYICGNSDESNDQRSFAFYYRYSDGTPNLRLVINDAGDATNDLYDIKLTIPSDLWSNVAVTWDASLHLASFYLNGKLMGRSTGSYQHTSIHTPISGWFSLGAYFGSAKTPPSSGMHYFDGMIDEFYLWSRVVSKREIQEYYLPILFPDKEPLPALIQ